MASPVIQPNSRRAYGLAAALLAVALLAQWSVQPLVGAALPFLFILPAIGIAAMWSGWRPALLVLVGGLAYAFLWPGPAAGGPAIPVALAGYLLAGGLLLALGGRLNALRALGIAEEDRLSEQVDDLEALHALNARVALLPELGQQLQAVLETLCRLLQADKGLLSLCDASAASLRVAASVGFSQASLQGELLTVPIGAGACGQAYAGRVPVIVADTETDPLFASLRELARREGFRAVHSRPLLHRSGEVFGVLSVHFAQARNLSEREQRLGDLCAGLAAVLAERDEALQRALASSHRLEVALDTSAVPFALLRPVHDETGAIRTFRWDYVNAAAARMMGRPVAELAGRPVRETVDAGVQFDPATLSHLLDPLQRGVTVQYETWVEHAGRRHWFEVIASPYDSCVALWFSESTGRREQEEALREADRRKDEFVATLAHELRNPLAPIRQAAMVACMPNVGDERKRWALDVVDRQVGHMAMLLDDLLDVSRITRGKLMLRKAPTELAAVVESALETARPLIDSRRQQLQTRLPAEAVYLDGDRLRIAQVLSNLLTNASKYTPEGGHVTLAARREGDLGVIEVSDDGNGIAPEALERIFEMFTQVRGGDGTRSGGLGIGLALSRGLVELHGGELEAHSAGLGQGSTFTVRLPCSPEPVQRRAPQQEQPAPARQRRVLVADDNRDAAQSLADLLRMQGHEVALAFDGAEALAQFDRHRPEVALLDIGMPHLTGYEVAGAIRGRADGARVLLVAITGWGQERDREAAREAGFDLHFTKPVDPHRVLRLLQEGVRNDAVTPTD